MFPLTILCIKEHKKIYTKYWINRLENLSNIGKSNLFDSCDVPTCMPTHALYNEISWLFITAFMQFIAMRRNNEMGNLKILRTITTKKQKLLLLLQNMNI